MRFAIAIMVRLSSIFVAARSLSDEHIPRKRKTFDEKNRNIIMDDKQPDHALVFLTAIAMTFTAGCSSIPNAAEHRLEKPSPYYLYLPKAYSPERAWPLFIGVHGSSTDGRSCWKTWQPFADEKGFVLLCPELADSDGRLHQLHGNQRLLDIINKLYQERSLMANIFLAGFSGGAQFVQGFAFMNPAYVTGVSVMATGNYYQPPRSASHIRFIVLVGDQDNPVSIQNAKDLNAMLRGTGYRTELHVLPDIGHQISKEMVEITLDLFDRAINDQ
jgi:predicted esterase